MEIPVFISFHRGFTFSTGGTAQHGHKGNITRLNGAFYYYDDENQLTAVMLTPTKLYSFAYDGKRRKRKQIEFNLVGSTWTPVGETWYIYDGMTVIQERSNTNAPTVHYTRGLDLSGTPGGAGGIGGTKIPQVVLDWVDKPAPDRPLLALPGDWTQHIPGTPEQLENIGMVSGLAGSAILISKGVGAGTGAANLGRLSKVNSFGRLRFLF